MPSSISSGIDIVLEAASGAAMMQAMAAAAELGVAEALAHGPRTVPELARQLNLHDASLRRLLRALVAIGICEEPAFDLFAVTPSGGVLQAEHDQSLHAWVRWFARYLWPEWAELAQCVRTGKTGRSLVRRARGLDHLDRDPRAAATFNAAMVEQTRLTVRALAAHEVFRTANTVMDIGGGAGELLCAILHLNPGVRGVLFDRPHAIECAHGRVHDAGLSSRCELVAGDFFHGVPAGGDVYVLKSVLHDWDDASSQRILQHCREAMNARGSVVLIEHVMPQRLSCSPDHRELARRDLTMLIGPGGRERTEGEFRELLSDAGLVVQAMTPTTPGFFIIEAAPG